MPIETNAGVVETLRARESALYFPVSIKPVTDIAPGVKNGGTNFQAVVREDTNELLAVHRGSYRLVSNQEAFQTFEEALGDSDIDMREVRIKDALSYNGGRVVRDYKFPRHEVDIGEQDPVLLQLRVQNSYDGSCRFSVVLGAFRILCSNGLVVGDTATSSRSKHTASLDVAAMAQDLKEAAENFIAQTETWKIWKDTPIPSGMVENVVTAIPGLSVTSQNDILERYRYDSGVMGATIWALYNAMTNWSTHTPVREESSGNVATIIADRESKIRRALNHPVFSVAA